MGSTVGFPSLENMAINFGYLIEQERQVFLLIGNCLYGRRCYGFPSLEIIAITNFGY